MVRSGVLAAFQLPGGDNRLGFSPEEIRRVEQALAVRPRARRPKGQKYSTEVLEALQ
jgi:hypothetical protein